MNRWTFLALVAIGCAERADKAHPDPALTDPDKYHVVLDNDRVRVLRYHDEPGEKTHRHHHPAFVLYALRPFSRRLTFPDGTSKERHFDAGDAAFMPAQDHMGENTGTEATDALLFELKQAER